MSRRLSVMLLLLLVVSSPTSRADETEDEARLLKAASEYRAARLAHFETESKKRGMSKEYTRRYVLLKKSLENSPLTVPELDIFNLAIGQIGTLGGNYPLAEKSDRFEVAQVIGPQSMMVRGRYSVLGGGAASRKTTTVWIEGVDTTGVVDESEVKIPQVLEVKGTKQYTTAIGGSNTVFELAPYSVQSLGFRSRDKAEREKPPSIADPSIDEQPLRTFSDATGDFKVQARFTAYGSGTVTLEKEDGTEIKVALDKFSKDDQKWLKEEIDRRRKKR